MYRMSAEPIHRPDDFTDGSIGPAEALGCSPVGIALTTLAGSLQYANDAFLKCFDVSATSWHGGDVLRLTHGLLNEDLLISVARDGRPRQVCFPVPNGDAERMLLCHVQRVMQGGLPIYLSLAVQDITDFANEYRERVQVLRSVLGDRGISGVWNWVMRLPTEEVGANPITWISRTEGLFGTKSPPTTFHAFLKFIAPHCRERVVAAISQAVTARTDYSVEYKAVTSDGSLRYMRSAGRYVGGAGYSGSRLICVELELTAAPTEIQSGGSTDELLKHIEVPVATVDRRLRYRYFNPAYAMLAAHASTLAPEVDQPVLQTVTDPVRRRLLANLLTRVMSGEQTVYEREVLDDRGEPYKWIEFHLKPIRTADGEIDGIMVLGCDVTPLKRADFRHRHLNAELRQRLERRMSKIDAANRDLSNRAAMVCDDLSDDLQQIKSLLGDAQHFDGSSVRQALAVLSSMETRIQGLERLASVGARVPQSRSIDMQRLVQEIRREQSFMAAGRSIEFDIGRLPEVVADRMLVKQVLQSLISNAIKFTRECVTPRIRVWASDEDGATVWSVADNGVGFDPTCADEMFSAFVRRGPKLQGVGLSVAWRAIQQLNGRLWCESSPGRGAIFHFTIGDQGDGSHESRPSHRGA